MGEANIQFSRPWAATVFNPRNLMEGHLQVFQYFFCSLCIIRSS